VVTNAGEDIEDFALVLRGIIHPARSEQGQVEGSCDANGCDFGAKR
jgi:hypothetical protein